MRAIVTRKNESGYFDEVGMVNRFVTVKYRTEKGLLRYGIPQYWRQWDLRVEFYPDNSIYGKPTKTLYLDKIPKSELVT